MSISSRDNGLFAKILEMYRQLAAEVGEEAAEQLADESQMSPPMREILRSLRRQPPSFKARRSLMVESIAASWAGSGARIDAEHANRALNAMGTIPRERFVDPHIADFAYLPIPLEIGDDQTISHPLMVACLTLAAQVSPGSLVLDVGTGCGYQAAVLAAVGGEVVSIEIRPSLAEAAAARLRALGIRNVETQIGDGCLGVPQRAPFDAIVVAAGAADPPRALLSQLHIGGRLVMPLGPSKEEEQLSLITRRADDRYERCSLGPARFVPLLGEGMRCPDSAGKIDQPMYCYGSSITSEALRSRL